jgi:uncharacterized protein (TIGR02466 family)
MTGNLMRTDLMPSVRYWFPTAVYDVNLGDYFIENNQAYYERGLFYKQNVPKIVSWKCDTYTTLSSVDLRQDQVFHSLIQKCKEHVLNFSKSFGVETRNITCKDAWLNIASTGNYQEYHVHPSSHFSLVYYVRAPAFCGDLIFRSPVGDSMYPLPIHEPTEPSCTTARYAPEEGRLLIFPSNLLHMVCKNESQEDRVSISMNFAFD